MNGYKDNVNKDFKSQPEIDATASDATFSNGILDYKNFLNSKNIWILKSNDYISPEPRSGIKYCFENRTHIFNINAQTEEPLIILYLNHYSNKNNENSSIENTINTNITVEHGHLTLIEYYISPNYENVEATNHPPIHSNLILNKNATVKHIGTQYGKNSVQKLFSEIILEANANYQGYLFSTDLFETQANVSMHLQGAFSEATFKALMSLNEQQKSTLSVLASHIASDTQSFIQTRGIADHRSKGEFTGKIWVHKNAERTKARLENKNLLLSNTAEIISRPLLEIYNDNVQCAHGATVGHLNPEGVFYLKSRGIPEPEAIQLLLEAFSKPIFDGLEQFAYNTNNNNVCKNPNIQASQNNENIFNAESSYDHA